MLYIFHMGEKSIYFAVFKCPELYFHNLSKLKKWLLWHFTVHNYLFPSNQRQVSNISR